MDSRSLREAAPATSRKRAADRGTSLQLVAQVTGHPISHRIDTASARLVTPEYAQLLELDPQHPPTEPVVVMTAKFVDSEGNIVEYGVDLGGPGRTWRTESEVTS